MQRRSADATLKSMTIDKCPPLLPFDQPSTYSIWVEGHIEPRWSDRLAGMGVRPSRRDDGTCITLLQGVLSDQAALVGLLNSLYQMHCVVLGVLRASEDGDLYRKDNP